MRSACNADAFEGVMFDRALYSKRVAAPVLQRANFITGTVEAQDTARGRPLKSRTVYKDDGEPHDHERLSFGARVSW